MIGAIHGVWKAREGSWEGYTHICSFGTNVGISVGQIKSWMVTCQKKKSLKDTRLERFLWSGNSSSRSCVVDHHQGRKGDCGLRQKVIRRADHPQGSVPHGLWGTLPRTPKKGSQCGSLSKGNATATWMRGLTPLYL